MEDNIIEIKNEISEIANILKKIEEAGHENNVLSHIEVDGIEVYEDYYEYLLDNIKVIEEIRLVSISQEKLIEEVLLSTLEYIKGAIPEIEKLSNSFYKTPNSESWENLGNLFEGINWIIETFSSIDEDKNLSGKIPNREEWNKYAHKVYSLSEVIKEMEEGLVNKDNILIADILAYEIVDAFKNMEGILFNLVGGEIVLNDLN